MLDLARDDADPRVRRAATARLSDPGVLGEIARTDPDEEVRGEAIRVLGGLAAELDDLQAAVNAARLLLALGRAREVVAVARDSVSPAVRAAVVDLLDDQKLLGTVSRQASDAGTRARALARVSDADELLAVALKAEHTDVAVAALERLVERDAVGAVAQRGRNKVAARRARTRLRALDEPVAPAPSETPMQDAERQRAEALLQAAEELVVLEDPAAAGAALAEVRMGWAELQADVDIEAGLAERFDAACDAVREAVAVREQERAEAVARAEALAREQAGRLAICSELETLSGPGAADRVAELKVAWDALPPMPTEYAASLNRRFQDASRACEERERRRVLGEAAVGRLETLATELERLLAPELQLEEVIARWRGLRRDTDLLREHATANPAAAERLERAVEQLEQKEQEHQQVLTRQELDNLKKLQQFCRQVEALVASERITLKAGDRALREIRAALDERAPLPTRQDRQDVQTRLDAARAALAPRLQELRDADEWQRWANLQVQEELCRAMEGLKEEADLDAASRRMRELQARWKPVALAPRTQGEVMWRRFKTAQDAIFTRTAAHLAAQHEERAANLARKEALCARAEALAESTDWVRTATEIQALQAEWKTVGPVNRGHEKAVWERFRLACDRFFSRRHEDLKHRKEDWAANLVRKEDLCARAEALAESTDWDGAAAQLRQMQADWKTTGPVRKSKSEAVWQRFRGACDRFFERYKRRDQVDFDAKAAVRDAVIQELEQLVADVNADAAPPEGLPRIIQEARTRWQQAPELPRLMLQDRDARFQASIEKLVAMWPTAFAGTDLDPELTRQRMEKLIAKIEAIVSGQSAPRPALSPVELLAQQWRERLAANTIKGSANGESDESRSRVAEQEVRALEAQWARLGPLAAEAARPLQERFQRACRRFHEQRKRSAAGV